MELHVGDRVFGEAKFVGDYYGTVVYVDGSVAGVKRDDGVRGGGINNTWKVCQKSDSSWGADSWSGSLMIVSCVKDAPYIHTTKDFAFGMDFSWGSDSSVDSVRYIKPIKKPMTLKEKFVLAITPEPQKSFRKAGITNGDDLLTEEGSRVFLSWLLTKNAEDFKKEVVNDLLKEKESE